ncbi:MAG: hypothetical protein ABEI32_06275 [Halothece sp.]
MLLSKHQFSRWLGTTFGSTIGFLFPLLSENQALLLAQRQAQPSAELQTMTLESLNTILRQEANNVNRTNQQQWRFQLQGRSMVVVANEKHNRMRIVAPITQAQELSSKQLFKMMVANYHSALDARYAINQQGVVVAAFLHPLTSLQKPDFRSALQQVANLAETFGTDYSSGELYFNNDNSQPRDSSPTSPNEIGI